MSKKQSKLANKSTGNAASQSKLKLESESLDRKDENPPRASASLSNTEEKSDKNNYKQLVPRSSANNAKAADTEDNAANDDSENSESSASEDEESIDSQDSLASLPDVPLDETEKQ